MTRRSAGRTRRGVALVVVLWTVALLATATAIASSAARTSASVTANARAQSIARSMAESGIVAAVALIDDSLGRYDAPTAAAARDALLSSLEPSAPGGGASSAAPLVADTLGDGVFGVTVVDVSARLDINSAGAEGLTTLFATVTSPNAARTMAERLDAMVTGNIGRATRTTAADALRQQRDSLNATLLGRAISPRARRPFASLDEVRAALLDVPGADLAALDKVAELLTVDGDGRINRRAASRTVLAAASGSLVDAPSRLLLIARGWRRGHPLTRQIEAVYDVGEHGLQLVRWREYDR
jgi:general secretion pathway protein K